MTQYESIVNEHGDHDIKDLSRARVLELNSGLRLICECRDPFGFWDIRAERGQLPKSLKGRYTSIDECRKAIDSWLNIKNKKVIAKKETYADFEEDKEKVDGSSPSKSDGSRQARA